MEFRSVYLLAAVVAVGCGKPDVSRSPTSEMSTTQASSASQPETQELESAESLIARISVISNQIPPARTPEQDPNLVETGPMLGAVRRLAPATASCECFSLDGKFAVYFDRPKIWSIDLGRADSQPQERGLFPFTPREVHVVNDKLDLLVLETESEQAESSAATDSARIWWMDQTKNKKQLLRGPERNLQLAEAPVSPDGRYVAFHQGPQIPDAAGAKVLLIHDRIEGSTVTIQIPDTELTVKRWMQTPDGLRAVVLAVQKASQTEQPPEVFLIDPTNGHLEQPKEEGLQFNVGIRTSPDGKFHVRIEPPELVVTDSAGKEERRFVVHPDDRRYLNPDCVEWVSPRYLKFIGPRLALIDVVTMKMSFPRTALDLEITPSSCQFSPDFRWVLFRPASAGEAELFVAPIN